MLKLRILSDLHLEHDPDWKLKHHGEDAVLCAGDMGTRRSRHLIEALVQSSEVPFYYVLGNHDFYHGEIEETVEYYCRLTEQTEQFNFLHNEYAHIGDYLLLGTPLWTDFNLYPGLQARSMCVAHHSINDFRLTRIDDRLLKPDDFLDWHTQSRAFLAERIGRGENTIVMTHWCPSAETIDARYAEDPANPYFTSECRDLMSPNVKLWVHGHSHTADDRVIGTTRVLRNPKGYPRERSGWKEDLIIELP
jgi:hypothetical protein